MGQTSSGFLGAEQRGLMQPQPKQQREELVSPKVRRPQDSAKVSACSSTENPQTGKQEEEDERTSEEEDEEEAIGDTNPDCKKFAELCAEEARKKREGKREGLSQGVVAETPHEESERKEEVEEGRDAQGGPGPITVSNEEREQHNRTHCPFRSWCKYCVRGRGKKMAHQSRTDEEKKEEAKNAVPKISTDYFYLSQEDEDQEKNPLIVMTDESTGEKYARLVGKKGINEDNQWMIKGM